MELLQLKYFQVVARLEHISKAAEELYVSQPALSKTISQLEKELGIRLFDRNGKYIKLNRYGKAFCSKVERALKTLEDAKHELKDMSNDPCEEIRLVVLASSHLLPELLSRFREQYPQVRFRLMQHLTNSYSQPDFDLCISAFPLTTRQIEHTPLLRESILLAVPLDHHLAKQSRVKLNELKNEKFIVLKKGKELRKITDAICKEQNFVPQITFESDDPATVRGLIRAKQGIGFIPEVTWGGSTGKDVKLLKIEEETFERTIFLTWNNGGYVTDLQQIFRQFVIDYFKHLPSDMPHEYI
ncbi:MULTISPECIES: LysR family transcriptional regulator [Priestia]|uniref:HTH-type transcriptional regulator GltC n=1 Tax=Priestia megaterium Q3 TaxID=1452722 RepID=A0A806U5L4_PRIMG|nr:MULTISPECIES: LysR family transcriptional regulator [Priestia]AKP75685.1 HTH-type transcriptional regulator GltC [Priestia megaterium Q3]NHH93566.1 HTH-type transcriptional regulator GltC [Bacillus sp. MB95]UPK49428.1 LysR family transcriptional regulator [Bacillus sp. H8-1]MBY0076082.1 LysR family transcriptional regulator [Priestia aryabhattai]MCM2974814.1 LysR family transcriptional regulator [Priestia aryabhattai]